LFPMCSSNIFLVAPNFVPYAWPNIVVLEVILFLCLNWILLYWGGSKVHNVLWWPTKEPHCKKEILNLECAFN
jgi:protein-S-isoprenylcysteine O-methyltransferase Ste14